MTDSDIVVITASLTPATYHGNDARRITLMRHDAVLGQRGSRTDRRHPGAVPGTGPGHLRAAPD